MTLYLGLCLGIKSHMKPLKHLYKKTLLSVTTLSSPSGLFGLGYTNKSVKGRQLTSKEESLHSYCYGQYVYHLQSSYILHYFFHPVRPNATTNTKI